MGPLLTGLVLTGRVGARMTAEIGTMRVTEQIDALETLAYDPIAYLVVPRVLAATIMLPFLVILADAVGVGSGYLRRGHRHRHHRRAFRERPAAQLHPVPGVLQSHQGHDFRLRRSPSLCSYEGYITGAGAEGVGRSTAKAVVITSVAILVLDLLITTALAQYLQG